MPDSQLFSDTDANVTVSIGLLVTAASRMIDRYCGVWADYFYPSTDAAARYFDGSGEREQEIDDCVSITTVSVAEGGGTGSTDYTDWATTDWIAFPYNYSALGVPINRLIIDRNGSKPGWYTYRKCVKVTGVFGYSLTPPADVAMACKIQAMRWYMRGKQAFQDSGASAALGQMFYMQELDPDVKMLLWNYQRVV